MAAIAPSVVPCAERERLEAIYRRALVDIDLAGKGIADFKSRVWREATKEARENARVALREFNRHRLEHGC